MALTIQFTRQVLPQGFKLTKDFVESPFFDETVQTIRKIIPKNKRILIVPQTDIKNREDSEYKPVFMCYSYQRNLSLASVINKLKNDMAYKIFEVDGAWIDVTYNDKAILSFSQTAPIITATTSCDGHPFVFISTMLRQNITKENFQKILDAIPFPHSEVTFKVVSATNYQYPEGTLFEQIEKIVTDLGCKYELSTSDANVNYSEYLFHYNETIPGYEELGLANNLVAIM